MSFQNDVASTLLQYNVFIVEYERVRDLIENQVFWVFLASCQYQRNLLVFGIKGSYFMYI